MRIVRLNITNFRGVQSASLLFDRHTLLVGPNNVGKSTICEALELVLGLDRLRRTPPVEEFDFFNARYLDKTLNPPQPIPIEIEVVVTDLSEELASRCVDRTEYWHSTEERLLAAGEIDTVDGEEIVECLRIKMVAQYNIEEDEFEAHSYFCSGPAKPDGSLAEVTRTVRQLFGFIYLRALRTGARALSLERGSLLDLILQRRGIRAGIWESAIERLRGLDPPIDDGAVTLRPVLENIEKRLGQYISLAGGDNATRLFVSKLTREHLRKTISFFLQTEPDLESVPFQEAGSGTLSTLLLALLSFLADSKEDTVVFAMEEPEIVVAPHTQRRIARYLLSRTDQCFITSHSPYIVECFEPEQVRVLRRKEGAVLEARRLRVGETLKAKTYRRHARRWFAEAMLGRGVIVGEGITERDILLAAADKLEQAYPAEYYPLDLSGISVICVDGEGSLAEFGEFFADLDIRTYALFDAKPIKPEIKKRIDAAYTVACQTVYKGAEKLLVEECPVGRLWEFLVEIRDSGEKPGLIPAGPMPQAARVKELALKVLKSDKGSGYAARVIELCNADELPETILTFITQVYSDFPAPEAVPDIPE